MPLTDQIKNYAKKLVENRPGLSALRSLVRSRKPLAIRFRDDGIVPNNPKSARRQPVPLPALCAPPIVWPRARRALGN